MSELIVNLRAAHPRDDAFIVEMARQACVIEDRPLPDPRDDEVLELLPTPGTVAILAEDHNGVPVGAVWTHHSSPPLRCDAAGMPLPELCIAVAPGHRGKGVGGLLLDALFADLARVVDAMCTNVHVRIPRGGCTSARVSARTVKATVRSESRCSRTCVQAPSSAGCTRCGNGMKAS